MANSVLWPRDGEDAPARIIYGSDVQTKMYSRPEPGSPSRALREPGARVLPFECHSHAFLLPPRHASSSYAAPFVAGVDGVFVVDTASLVNFSRPLTKSRVGRTAS